MRFKPVRPGFTLIELVTSIAIMAIMATMVAPEIGKARNDQDIFQAAQLLKTKIIEAQGFALSPPENNDSYEYYGVKLGPGGTFQIVRTKLNSIDEFRKPVELERISSITPNGLILFKVGNKPEVLSTSPTNVTITHKTGQARQITINRYTGAVDVK